MNITQWGQVEGTLGSMRLSWGQWGSVEIVRGPMGSVGIRGVQWESLELTRDQWGSVRNVYTLLKNDK